MTVRSELSLLLPERPGAVRTPDVEVREGDPGPDGPGLHVEVNGVEARILDGTTVVVDPGEAEKATVSKVVIKRGLLGLLLERGVAVLHAGAVDVGGRAVAFAGPQDAGKSSLVTAMCARGNGFLTDDVLAVAEGDDAWRAVPAYPRVSLTPEAREALDFDGRRVASMEETASEPWFEVGSRFETESVPLDTVYLLEERGGVDAPTVRAVEGQTAMERLVRHSVRSWEVGGTDPVRRQFRQCVGICQSAAVKTLERPDGFDAMPEVVDCIEADLEAH